MKRVILTYLFVASVLVAAGQQLIGRAPSRVQVNEMFRLSYTVNTHDVEGFRGGAMPKGLEVVSGPNTSMQSSYQTINGRTSGTSSVTYTYILIARRGGTFRIPPARVTIGGKQITSNEVQLKASGQSQPSQQQQGSVDDADVDAVSKSGAGISGSDLFIRVTASKRRVHEQEPILLTYKVYTTLGLTDLIGKMPDLKNFYTREVQLPVQKHFVVETLNGRGYKTVIWSQYVMFPQASGKLEIPPITFEGIVLKHNPHADPLEEFFNGGPQEVKKKIKAPGITIDVDPLPKHPQDFSGGVGRFTISAQPDHTELKANDPLKLRVTVNGSGNMKLLKQPVVSFPKDFDTYDAKVTDNTRLTTSGLEGDIVYDYLAVPRHSGTFNIPGIKYTYFDTAENAYKTLTTDSFTVHVAKGTGGSEAVSRYTDQEEVVNLNNDIHHIHMGSSRLSAVGDFFFGSVAYWITLAVLAVSFVSLFVVFRRRAIERADLVKQRAGKAGKVAARRLRTARRLMDSGRRQGFYDEVLRALWGYVGDRLNMPVEQLSRDNVSQQLAACSVSQPTIDTFLKALDDCEYARYAPGDAAENMNQVYEAAMTAITEIAKSVKHSGGTHHSTSAGSVAHIIIYIVLLTASVPLNSRAAAVTKAAADSAYMREDYRQAASLYEQLLKQGHSADVYYNLGNAYYRLDNMSRAILNYERALVMAPGDNDIRFNLQMARAHTVDKITPESEMFFVTWYRSCRSIMSADGWAWLSIVSLVAAIVMALLYLFADRLWLRKTGFFGCLPVLVLFGVGNLFAFQQKSIAADHSTAIVMQSAVTVKSTPSAGGTDLFVLHEGTKLTIVDPSMKDWVRVRVADGREGWIEKKRMETI